MLSKTLVFFGRFDVELEEGSDKKMNVALGIPTGLFRTLHVIFQYR